jgi:hypothetical protein
VLAFCLIIGDFLLEDGTIGVELFFELANENLLLLILFVVVHGKGDFGAWVAAEEQVSGLHYHAQNVLCFIRPKMYYVEASHTRLVFVLCRKYNSLWLLRAPYLNYHQALVSL